MSNRDTRPRYVHSPSYRKNTIATWAVALILLAVLILGVLGWRLPPRG